MQSQQQNDNLFSPTAVSGLKVISGFSLQNIPGFNLINLGLKEEAENVQRLRGLRQGIEKVKSNIKSSSNKFHDTLAKSNPATSKPRRIFSKSIDIYSNESYQFKSRMVPDSNIMQLNKMIEDPEFIDKYPDLVEQLINPSSNSQKQINPSPSFLYDSSKQGSVTSRGYKSKAKQFQGEEEEEIRKSKRDFSFQNLIRKIQESSRALKASKSGKSIFTTNNSSVMGGLQESSPHGQKTQIPLFAKKEMRQDFDKLLNMNGPKFPPNNAGKRNGNRTTRNSTQINFHDHHNKTELTLVDNK